MGICVLFCFGQDERCCVILIIELKSKHNSMPGFTIWGHLLLLMEEILHRWGNGSLLSHDLRWVFWYVPGGVSRISEPSTVWFIYIESIDWNLRRDQIWVPAGLIFLALFKVIFLLSTTVYHHTPPFGRICLTFPSILSKSKLNISYSYENTLLLEPFITHFAPKLSLKMVTPRNFPQIPKTEIFERRY